MKKTIGIFAHVDAGKTTFSEQLLYHTGMIRSIGRVDHQNASLDHHDIEKKRGITIFSDQAYFNCMNDMYYLIDTPGHVDFSSEMERAINILDYAIIIISGIDGIQGHTETVYELLNKAQVPVMFFINKLDAAHADKDKVINELKENFIKVLEFDDIPFEGLADYSENLMEMFFDDNLDESVFLDEAKKLLKSNAIHPVMTGSALKDQGIDEFLCRLSQLTETDYSDNEPGGVVYKVKYEKGIRQTYIKLTSGTLKVRDSIGEEKITDIKKCFGTKFESVGHIEAGDVAVFYGLSLKVGDTFGDAKSIDFEMQPTLTTTISFDPSINPKDVYRDMKILEDEDPSLMVSYSSKKEITLGIMGLIQLEILKEVIPSRFDYQVEFLEPQIIYKESISNTVIGCGHFEPLKHYAEVILKIEKGPLGSGIVFVNECSTDDMSVGHQNLVKHHIFEKPHRGILTGSEITDIKVTLMTGRAHNKHTSGGDFREATIRALRQGLEQADNLILEPIYEAVIRVPFTDMGKVLTDITTSHGSAETRQDGDDIIITARVPVYTFKDYNTRLLSITSGHGRMRLKVVGYDVCHNQNEVIESIAYDKITDDAYPSSSIFCSKGKGYTVPWHEAKDHMHTI